MNIDFWTESIKMFKQRVQVYDKALSLPPTAKHEEHSAGIKEDVVESFQAQENRLCSMMGSYFQLFNNADKFVDVMDTL